MDKARQKLSQFALPNPRLYVLNLLASAVAAGASAIEFSLTTDRVWMAHNGQAPEANELETLWVQLLHPASTSLYELAIGMNAARAISPVELAVETWVGGHGSRLEVVGTRLELQALAAPGWDHETYSTRICLRESSLKKPLRYLAGVPEYAFLRGCHHMGPARVILNGNDITRAIQLGNSPKTAAWLHLSAGQPKLEAEPPSADWAAECLTLAPSHTDEPVEAILALAPLEHCNTQGLTIICNGVPFSYHSTALGYAFATGVVSVGHLRKNVSHTKLAEDRDYRRLLQFLQDQVELLLVRRLEDPRPLPLAIVPAILARSSALIRSLQIRGLPEAAASVERWTKEARFSEDILNDATWRAVCLTLEEKTDQAELMAIRLRATLRSGGIGNFGIGQIHKSCTYWDRIVAIGQLRPAPAQQRDKETLALLQGMSGRGNDASSTLDPDCQATLLRLSAQPEEALPLCSCSFTKAEVLLALGQAEPAEHLLRQILCDEDSPAAAETLSDLLAFSEPRDPSRRREALDWRERSSKWRQLQWDVAPAFMLDDLAQLARPVLPFYSWLGYRARASLTSWSGPTAELVAGLSTGRDSLRTKKLGSLAIKSAMLAAESAFGPAHIVVEVARSRAAHLLREANLWGEADDLVARGHAIRLLRERFHAP